MKHSFYSSYIKERFNMMDKAPVMWGEPVDHMWDRDVARYLESVCLLCMNLDRSNVGNKCNGPN